jgi:MFS transporter, ACS family, tartrate transporter
MIVYLTHWFRLRERSRAIACLYAAVPAASLVGSPLAGFLLGVHWLRLAGWRWLFILEGIPAIVLGILTAFYLTDWPSQARWLPQDEGDWLVNELRAELQVKKTIRSYTIMQAFCDLRTLRLMVAYFLAIPTMTLTEAAAAATFGLINSIGQLGGFAGNYTIGLLNVRTHSLAASFGFIARVWVVAGGTIVSLGIRNPPDPFADLDQLARVRGVEGRPNFSQRAFQWKGHR